MKVWGDPYYGKIEQFKHVYPKHRLSTQDQNMGLQVSNVHHYLL